MIRPQPGDTVSTQPCGSHQPWSGSNGCSVLPTFTPTTTKRSTASMSSTVSAALVASRGEVMGSTASARPAASSLIDRPLHATVVLPLRLDAQARARWRSGVVDHHVARARRRDGDGGGETPRLVGPRDVPSDVHGRGQQGAVGAEAQKDVVQVRVGAEGARQRRREHVEARGLAAPAPGGGRRLRRRERPGAREERRGLGAEGRVEPLEEQARAGAARLAGGVDQRRLGFGLEGDVVPVGERAARREPGEHPRLRPSGARVGRGGRAQQGAPGQRAGGVDVERAPGGCRAVDLSQARGAIGPGDGIAGREPGAPALVHAVHQIRVPEAIGATVRGGQLQSPGLHVPGAVDGIERRQHGARARSGSAVDARGVT